QIDAVDAQTGPVLLAYRPIAEVAAILKAVTAGAPAYDIVAHDGIGHTLWLIDRAEWVEGITRAFAAQKAVYIADGHHRSAAASRVAAARRQADAGARGDALYESFLTVAFPSDEMRILDYNRVVRDLNGLSREDFLARLENAFTVVPVSGQARPDGVTVFGLYLSGQWYRLELKRKPDSGMDPVERLDVSLLTDHVLTPILGIADLRKDKRIDFVGGRRGLDELEKRVNSGEMAVAFALWPTSLDDLFAVADADKVMPPKSTWFEPKLADGLISYPLR
ncbi:MAG: DUF1015 family protein, partial [Rhodospirillales bacterium]|nr:DUF1015 family protein [Rhodospirillales bacterium]